MPRMRAISLACRAIFGRCSEILTPGAAVAISLNGPPLAWPGFKSHRSMVLGPPFIHRRMHERLREGSPAAALASEPNQPDIDAPTTPAEDSFSHSRRDRDSRFMVNSE